MLSIEELFKSQGPIFFYIIICIGISLGLLVLTLIHITRKLKGSEGLLTSVRFINNLIRILTLLETVAILPLIYFVVSLGPPFQLNQVTSYGNGDSWIYGYGRPVAGFILIGFGAFSSLSYIIRYIAMLACMTEAVFDCISSIQVYSYKIQTIYNSAPLGKYSETALTVYIIRDLISIILCLLLLYEYMVICCLLGWGPQSIPFHLIEGGELDRAGAMRKQYRATIGETDADDDNGNKHHED